MKNNSKFSIGDAVHFKDDTTAIYQITRIYPTWYKGTRHIEMNRILPSIEYLPKRQTAAFKIVLAEPELLL